MDRNLEPSAMNNELLNEVKTVIINAVNLHHVKPDSITESTTMGPDGLNLDSIDILEVVLAVERHFQVKVENSEKGRDYFKTIGTITSFIAQQKAKA